MKQFLESLIKSIVEKPDAVSITEEQDDQGRQLLIISVDPEDMGRVIGKSGKVINAVRTIMRVVAIRQGVKIRVDIKDDQPRATSSDSDSPKDSSASDTEPETPSASDLVQAPELEESDQTPDKTATAPAEETEEPEPEEK